MSKQELGLHYQEVRRRVKYVFGEKIPPKPEIDNWHEITSDQLGDLRNWMNNIHDFVCSSDNTGSIHQLNPDKSSFDTHLRIHDGYVQLLGESKGFQVLYPSVPVGLLRAVSQMHDFERFMVNGMFPLSYVDKLGNALIHRLFPNYPRHYEHKIEWITGEEALDFNQLTSEQEIGLMIKGLDTMSKLNSHNLLLTLEELPHRLDSWADLQVAKQRFPFKSVVNQRASLGRIGLVTRDNYVAKDLDLTNRGIALVEHVTGSSFASLRQELGLKLGFI